MIDPTTQLAALIRAQLAAQFRAQAKLSDGGVAGKGTAANTEARAHKASSHSGAPTPASQSEDARLQQLVALRVRALSPTDPQRERKAFRLFLESVLIQSFGRDRLDDRGLDQLVDTVLQRMESDTELRVAVKQAGSLLLAEAQPGDVRGG